MIPEVRHGGKCDSLLHSGWFPPHARTLPDQRAICVAPLVMAAFVFHGISVFTEVGMQRPGASSSQIQPKGDHVILYEPELLWRGEAWAGRSRTSGSN